MAETVETDDGDEMADRYPDVETYAPLLHDSVDHDAEKETTPTRRSLLQTVIQTMAAMKVQLVTLLSQYFSICKVLGFLVPKFIPWPNDGNQPVSKRELLPTAYLDALRGLAALFVFFCHMSYTVFSINIGYG